MATQNEIADAGKSLETDNSGGIRTAEQEAIERITLKPAPASVLLGHSGEGMKPLRGAEFPLDGLEPVVGAEQFMKDVLGF